MFEIGAVQPQMSVRFDPRHRFEEHVRAFERRELAEKGEAIAICAVASFRCAGDALSAVIFQTDPIAIDAPRDELFEQALARREEQVHVRKVRLDDLPPEEKLL